MLDEEVNFTLLRDCPKSKLHSTVEDIGELVAILGGSVAGFFGVKHGLDLGNWGGLLLGLPTGLCITGSVVEKILAISGDLRQKSYEAKENNLDVLAKNNGVETVRFVYRGNKVECVLRQEYDSEGHIFYMSLKDNVLCDPVFSYQPKREKSLVFKFSMPKFKEKANATVNELLDERMKELLTGKKSNVSSAKVENEYATAIHAEIKKNGKEFDVCFEKDGVFITTIIKYSGENYKSCLAKFSRVVAESMKQAYAFRTKHDF